MKTEVEETTEFLKVTVNGEVLDSKGQVLAAVEAKDLLESTTLNEKFVYLASKDQILEVFDFLFIIKSLSLGQKDKLEAIAQYGIELNLDLNQIYLDYKDRFIIYNEVGIPCVLSDYAQNQLFDLCDEYSDNDITINGVTYDTALWLSPNSKISESHFWSERYIEQRTEWDLNEPTPCLVWALKKFKLPKMRVAVLGCGRGHDAAYIASLGHKVTGFDFSSEAISEAQKIYGNIKDLSANLSWSCEDIFNLNSNHYGQYDLVFDHTLFCAIDPEKRDQLLGAWHKLLAPQGQILGVFFTMPKPDGPPYGATEEEILTRVTKKFRKDFWERSKVSTPKRMGKELIVLATKSE